MYPYRNEAKDEIDDNDKSQTRQTENKSSLLPCSSSRSHIALLVIDDNSNSNDLSINHINNIPKTLISTMSAQLPHPPMAAIVSPSTHDYMTMNGSAEQHRRRNSSIAKLLGGQPLNNQQYEEINQQILDDRSAQNAINNPDNGTDSGIQRTRSSITRTLLMNNERTNNIPNNTNTSQIFPKDYDYLIRQEVDKNDSEHISPPIQSNKDSISNNANSKSYTQTKLKRKRSVSKSPSITLNKSTTNMAPFSLRNPFELVPTEQKLAVSTHQIRNDFNSYDMPKRPRHSNSQEFNLNNNQTSSSYHNNQLKSSIPNQFNINHHRFHLIPYSNSFDDSCCLYPNKLPLPSPTTIQYDNSHMSMSSSKTKSMLAQPDKNDFPRQRSYSSITKPSESLLSTLNQPLKKRLLQVYNNEQHPASPL